MTCETDAGSRSEVRGFQNFEPGTSNFVSRPSRLSQASQTAHHTIVCSQGDRGPEFHHDPQDRCHGKQLKHDSSADDAGHIQPACCVSRYG